MVALGAPISMLEVTVLPLKLLDESWNCIVGKNFGSHVVHQSRSYMFANLNDEISVLLWKAA